MTAETLRSVAGPNGALLSERALARLAAHHLVQHVQQRDTGSEVAESLVVAESRGWSEVVRVLLYAGWSRCGQDRAPSARPGRPGRGKR